MRVISGNAYDGGDKTTPKCVHACAWDTAEKYLPVYEYARTHRCEVQLAYNAHTHSTVAVVD